MYLCEGMCGSVSVLFKSEFLLSALALPDVHHGEVA